MAIRRVESLDGPDETDVSLVNEFKQRESGCLVMLADADDESQIRSDHSAPGFFAVVIDDLPGKFTFFLGGQQRYAGNLA